MAQESTNPVSSTFSLADVQEISPGVNSKYPPLVFVFLEIFSQEGGIQSYVRDIFQAYSEISDNRCCDVFLLRDHAGCHNPFQNTSLNFHYFATGQPLLGRIRLAIALYFYLLRQRP